MATAAALAALRAMALGTCGGGSSNEEGYHDSRGKDDGNGSNGISDEHSCCPRHSHFVTNNVVANAIARVVAITIAFVSMQQRGQW
jgi:hypothetical protein